MRLRLSPGPCERNASTLPLVSPFTRLEAADRNATQRGELRKLPSTDGANDGPLAGLPCLPLERRIVLPGCQTEPSLPKLPPRRIAKTSLTPLVSPVTRSDASDWKAIMRA